MPLVGGALKNFKNRRFSASKSIAQGSSIRSTFIRNSYCELFHNPHFTKIANDTGIYNFQSDASPKQFIGDATHHRLRCYKKNKTNEVAVTRIRWHTHKR